jgi:hypothetical protein
MVAAEASPACPDSVVPGDGPPDGCVLEDVELATGPDFYSSSAAADKVILSCRPPGNKGPKTPRTGLLRRGGEFRILPAAPA